MPQPLKTPTRLTSVNVDTYEAAGHTTPSLGKTSYPKGRVTYRSLAKIGHHQFSTVMFAIAAFTLQTTYLTYLFWPSHLAPITAGWSGISTVIMELATGLIDLFLLVNVVTICHSILVACDPLHIKPTSKPRIAFLTTIVPAKEPVAIVQKTLMAARNITYHGQLDVWLLDEGNDPIVKAMCRKFKIKHFSRLGIEKYNTATGEFKTRSKNGNYNAWMDAHGDQYDFIAGVDPDHIPRPNYIERMLGYFDDVNVAFVVGPQVYGNYHQNFVTRAAEAMQFIFHGLLQRAGNAYRCAMLVGTNNMIRVTAYRQVHGLSDSITEDMATGLKIHMARNPLTGQRWQSVYTPDVLAVGEGPSSWTDFISQQLRWARGTMEVLLHGFLPMLITRPSRGLKFRERAHYSMLMSYYPTVALSWLLGTLTAILNLGFGVGGIHIAFSSWFVFYSWASISQLSIYFFYRRHNVSPHEKAGSSGVLGMFMAMITIPIFVTALIGAVLKRELSFVTTPKGDVVSADRMIAFSKQLKWMAFLILLIAYAVYRGNVQPAYFAWVLLSFGLCLTPFVILGPRWVLKEILRLASEVGLKINQIYTNYYDMLAQRSGRRHKHLVVVGSNASVLTDVPEDESADNTVEDVKEIRIV